MYNMCLIQYRISINFISITEVYSSCIFPIASKGGHCLKCSCNDGVLAIIYIEFTFDITFRGCFLLKEKSARLECDVAFY